MPPTVATQRPKQNDNQHSAEPFPGFQNLTANFVYCPNQFCDVCLPNHSRGVVRLVGYLLRRTLGWLDGNGDPVEQHIAVSYQDLITEARISRGAIRKSIDEAIAGGFIRCTQPPRANSSGKASQTGLYMLRWDAADEYNKNADSFQGFFSGEGHRTPIPNAFFDHVLPHETLAVVKIVGTVLRHTVGYQNQFGGRRTHARLSYSYIQRYANLRDRPTLAQALRMATASGYICRVDQGSFNHRANIRRPASYAIEWLAEADTKSNGSENQPARRARFKSPTNSGSKTQPLKQSKKPTQEKTQPDNTLKQQHNVTAVAVANLKSYELLRDAGFDEQIAKDLSKTNSFDDIQRQITWLEKRKPRRNPIGLLRRAIEEKWSEPIGEQDANHTVREREKREQDTLEAEKAAKLLEQTQQRRSHRLAKWRKLPADRQAAYFADAIQHASSAIVRSRLLRCRDLDRPTTEVLAVMAADCDSR